MLEAHNISKVYRLYPRPVDRIREMLSFGLKTCHTDFWALKGIDLAVRPGETYGIVGPNGSGKSTLLQLLCGILEPTTGRVVRHGRVAALLELGAGFNPEFSGRENIYLNGEIMGLPRERIDAAMPAIERFAGIGDFIEQPIKTYSSGMHVRLAFSAAIHVDPDILVVDEALAVGDAVFANRCVAKFAELKERGVTVVFVSHDLGLVKQICDRAAFLLNGEMVEEGGPAAVVNRYVGTVLERQKAFALEAEPPQGLTPTHRHGDRLGEIVDLEILDSSGRAVRTLGSRDEMTVRVRARFHAAQADPMIGILIRTRNGLDVFGSNTRIEETPLGACSAGDEVEAAFTFACNLTAQQYTLTAAAQHPDGHSHDWLDDALAFRVLDRKARAGVADLQPRIEIRRPTGSTKIASCRQAGRALENRGPGTLSGT